MSLLYRGHKKPDEFLVDYIARMSFQNGFRLPSKFKKYLRDEVDKFFDGSGYDLFFESQWRLGLELCISRNIDIDEHRRVTSSKCFLWRRVPTICNQCFESEQYIRFYWWISSYQKCHFHDVVLPETKVNSATESQKVLNKVLVDKLPELLNMCLSHEKCQRIVVDAFEHFLCISKIIKGLKSYLDKDERIGKVLKDLEIFLSDRLLSDNGENERILVIASFLSSKLGEYDFWMRIICMLIFNHLSGLKSDFPVNQVGAKYLRVSIYYLSTDKGLLYYTSKILDFRATHETFDIPLENLLPQKYSFSEEFVRAYRFSLYRCRTLDYFSQCLGRDRVRRIGNSIVCNAHESTLQFNRSM